jgi:hypothetical protein
LFSIGVYSRPAPTRRWDRAARGPQRRVREHSPASPSPRFTTAARHRPDTPQSPRTSRRGSNTSERFRTRLHHHNSRRPPGIARTLRNRREHPVVVRIQASASALASLTTTHGGSPASPGHSARRCEHPVVVRIQASASALASLTTTHGGSPASPDHFVFARTPHAVRARASASALASLTKTHCGNPASPGHFALRCEHPVVVRTRASASALASDILLSWRATTSGHL